MLPNWTQLIPNWVQEEFIIKKQLVRVILCRGSFRCVFWIEAILGKDVWSLPLKSFSVFVLTEFIPIFSCEN